MTNRTEMDPLDVLRDANPVDVDQLSSASLARIRARVSEDVMSVTAKSRKPPWPFAVVGVAGGVAAVAIALALMVGQRPGAPGVVPGSTFGSGSAFCVEPYSPTTLARRDVAFDGTVTRIDGDRVTFTVNRVYRGVQGPSVELDAPGMTGAAVTSAGGPNLVVSGRYLVAGDDRFVWACGYTQPYDTAVAAEWEAALGG